MIETFKHIKNQLSSLYPSKEAEQIAYLLMEAILMISRIDIFTTKDKPSEEHGKLLDKALKELQTGKPIQQVIGFTFFRELKIKVNKDVLIPRPETEELVELFIQENRNRKGKILDIGTGSGCIAISIQKELPDLQVSAVDISEKALDTAAENARQNQADIQLLHFDILNENEWPRLKDHFDFIISNPPYVKESEKKLMQKNVLEYEPSLALFVEDNNPLIFYSKIAAFAKTRLKPNGKIYFEINETLGPETTEVLSQNGFSNTRLYKDLRGKARFVTGIKNI